MVAIDHGPPTFIFLPYDERVGARQSVIRSLPSRGRSTRPGPLTPARLSSRRHGPGHLRWPSKPLSAARFTESAGQAANQEFKSMSDTRTFEALGLSSALLRALDSSGYTIPTPIQEQAIPLVLAGHDVLGAAQTGTGKTAAFGLPMLQRLAKETPPKGPRKPRALILVPTRELAVQVAESIKEYGRHMRLNVTTIFGGAGMQPQIDNLRRGVDILVACPGRLLDHMENGHAKLDAVEVLVLDEADRMLDMGFLPSIKRIMGRVPKQRQTLLFSATFEPRIKALAL